MVPQWIIEKKRDGKELSEGEIRDFIAAYSQGTLPDYQMSALAMAIYFQGMTTEETAYLTDAMMHSGRVLDLSQMPRPTADKHSTGGIGDKISLILGPLAAATGLCIPMISGRGLGITGGTLDKLDSIPGYKTNLDIPTFTKIVEKIGCSIIGQTADLAPADKKLYALRDVTATVPSIPLITASIMSKKLAEGAQTLVFDVKCGEAAFMTTPDQALALAKSLEHVGRALGRKTAYMINDMNAPTGQTAGNALEVKEAIDILLSRGPKSVRDLTIDLVTLMHQTAQTGVTRDTITEALDSGKAAQIFAQMVEAQGGNPAILDNPNLLQAAPHTHPILAQASGTITRTSALSIGKSALLLGAGRRATTDKIDYSAGISHILPPGTPVTKGDLLCLLHYSSSTLPEEASHLALSAFSIA